jgi:hypothetical protein
MCPSPATDARQVCVLFRERFDFAVDFLKWRVLDDVREINIIVQSASVGERVRIGIERQRQSAATRALTRLLPAPRISRRYTRLVGTVLALDILRLLKTRMVETQPAALLARQPRGMNLCHETSEMEKAALRRLGFLQR